MSADRLYRLGGTFTGIAFICWLLGPGSIFTIGFGLIALTILLRSEAKR